MCHLTVLGPRYYADVGNMMTNDADFAQMLTMCYGVSGDGLGYVDVFKALSLPSSTRPLIPPPTGIVQEGIGTAAPRANARLRSHGVFVIRLPFYPSLSPPLLLVHCRSGTGATPRASGP